MSGTTLRWKGASDAPWQDGFSGAVMVATLANVGGDVWAWTFVLPDPVVRGETEGAGAARAAAEAAWGEWCARAEVASAGEWQPIATAPDGPLMLFSPGAGGNVPGGVVWVSGGWRYPSLAGGFRGDALHGEPSHWRPLPGPPDAGAAP